VQRRLELQFVSGRRYQYHDVPEETWRDLRHVFSKGEFFNHYIRGQYSFVRSDSEAHVSEPHVCNMD